MKNQFIFTMIAIIILISLFSIINLPFTGKAVSEQKTRLGYCPTMKEDAKILSEKEGYELVRFDSASEVLLALNRNQISKGLIGRKAKSYEILKNTKETILSSDYTLVSNKKRFVDVSNLPSMEIYTYLEKDFNFPVKRTSKEEVLEKIKDGKVSLISWGDWQDKFELVVVINGDQKVKEFRGLFLYEN